MTALPIEIHFGKLEEWIEDRKAVLGKKHQGPLAACLKLAPQMVQAVRYDIPALKKQLSKLVRQREEYAQQIADGPKAMNALEAKRRVFLESYGFSTEEVADVERLESILDKKIAAADHLVSQSVNQAIPQLIPAVFAAYDEQLRRVCDSAGSSSSSCRADKPSIEPQSIIPLSAQAFPWLERLAWEAAQTREGDAAGAGGKQQTGCAPDASTMAEGDCGSAGIDWGDDLGVANDGAEAVVEIQWEDDAAILDCPPSDAVPSSSSPPIAAAAATTTGLQAEASAKAHLRENDDVHGPPPLLRDGGSSGPTIVLSRTEHRMHVIAEVHALKHFLEERILDRLNEIDEVANDENRNRHAGELVALLRKVEALHLLLTEGVQVELLRMRQQFRVKQRFLDAAESLTRSMGQLRSRVQSAEDRLDVVDAEVTALRPELQRLVGRTKEMQRECQQLLQQVFPDREVLITGDINVV